MSNQSDKELLRRRRLGSLPVSYGEGADFIITPLDFDPADFDPADFLTDSRNPAP